MRYLAGFVFVLAALAPLPLSVSAQAGEEAVPKVALAIHRQHRLPPQLMLRGSYYLYLDADADNRATSDETEPNAEESKSAQVDGEVATSESNLEEPVSSPAPATEVPDIDALGQRAIEHYETRSAQRTQLPDQRRARRGLIASSVIVAAGAAAVVGGVAIARSKDELSDTGPAIGLTFTGGALMVGGIIGVGISGKRLSTARRGQRKRLLDAHHGKPRRAQWDLAQSRLVF